MDYLFSFTDYGEHIPELIPAAHGFSPIRKETTGKMECALTGRTDAAPRDSRADSSSRTTPGRSRNTLPSFSINNFFLSKNDLCLLINGFNPLCRVSGQISKWHFWIAGPITTRRDRGGIPDNRNCNAIFVAIPLTMPRHPACAMPTAEEALSQKNTGRQSAVKIPRNVFDSRVKSPSARGPRRGKRFSTTRILFPWTCVHRTRRENGISSLRKNRFLFPRFFASAALPLDPMEPSERLDVAKRSFRLPATGECLIPS